MVVVTDRHYVPCNKVGHIVSLLEAKFGQLERVTGGHWIEWIHEGKAIAGHCDSPYPGPEYGSSSWIRNDLVQLVNGIRIPVLCSRGLTGTEAHIINKRLRTGEHVCGLIIEVEHLYDQLMKRKIKEIDIGSGRIYWYEYERLTV